MKNLKKTKNITEYRDIWSTILRGFWSDLEVDAIESAIADVAMNPSPMVDIFEKDGKKKNRKNWSKIYTPKCANTLEDFMSWQTVSLGV